MLLAAVGRAEACVIASRSSRAPTWSSAPWIETGLHGREAASYYRALADTALAVSAFEASFNVLDKGAQEGDRLAWRREYLTASPRRYPNLAQVAPYLAEIDEEEQFETAIGLFLDAVELRAQRARGEGSEHTEN